MADYFASRSYQWFEAVDSLEVSIKSEELYQECVKEVEAEVSIVTKPTEIEETNLELDKEYQKMFEK